MKKHSKPSPSTNGGQTGRDSAGRFTRGNPGGPGNPAAALIGKRRARLLSALKDSDIDEAVKTLRDVMKSGKDSDRLVAVKIVLERAAGPIVALDIIERLERLERQLLETNQ